MIDKGGLGQRWARGPTYDDDADSSAGCQFAVVGGIGYVMTWEIQRGGG
jgi:hypothetical protein